MEGPRAIDSYQKPKHKLRSTNGPHFSSLRSKSGHFRVKIGNQNNKTQKDGSETKQVPTTSHRPLLTAVFQATLSNPEQSIALYPMHLASVPRTWKPCCFRFPASFFSGPRTWNRMVKWRSWKTPERWDWMRLVCTYFPSVFNVWMLIIANRCFHPTSSLPVVIIHIPARLSAPPLIQICLESL